MIQKYENGQQFIDDNKAFLDTNPYLAVFFYWDAPLLKEVNHINYAFKCLNGNDALLAIKVEPYNLLLFGSEQCVEELFGFLLENNYEIKNVLCPEEVGDVMKDYLKNRNIEFVEALAMDFMTANEITAPSDPEVENATIDDLDEICECLEHFVVDCGLEDKINKERVAKTITSFKVLRKDGMIVSMANAVAATGNDYKITDVYTRDQYRGKGYGRRVVNTLKNEIIESGKLATLNVDKKNPISNRIYKSIGFKKLFSQGEYRRVQ